MFLCWVNRAVQLYNLRWRWSVSIRHLFPILSIIIIIIKDSITQFRSRRIIHFGRLKTRLFINRIIIKNRMCHYHIQWMVRWIWLTLRSTTAITNKLNLLTTIPIALSTTTTTFLHLTIHNLPTDSGINLTHQTTWVEFSDRVVMVVL